ncbi:hypothetical protein [Sphingomonas aliaeris]|uniref:hypothetical protein n=1 Tax=Sphingomonas aliaeris TaxID=2759526 RepID=UPI001CED04F3|nr:hypothetical protein [Sphingomonas aliaeris]
MSPFDRISKLISDEKHVREQAAASDSISARIALFAPADGYAAEIKAYWTTY